MVSNQIPAKSIIQMNNDLTEMTDGFQNLMYMLLVWVPVSLGERLTRQFIQG